MATHLKIPKEMKGTDQFKKTIEQYLNSRAASDPLFAETMKKDAKTIDDCIKYILTTVKKSGCSGFADDEIYNMAVHYYDEDNLKVDPNIKCNVVVNHTTNVDPHSTISTAKADVAKGKSKKIVSKIQPITHQQTSLFDL